MSKFVILIALFAASLSASSQEFLITSYGVGTDSTKLNTEALQSVINKAHESGGGTIIIPKGVFLTGALFFKPKTQLRLLEGAVLKGSDDIKDYPLIPSRMEGKSILYYAALINAYYVDNFSITGPGTINGNGLKYWKAFWAYRDSLKQIGKEATNLDVHRPRLVFIWGCNKVELRDVKLWNSGFWTTHLYQSNDVLIDGCDIRAPFKPVPAPSSDGVDIDVCKRVTIRNCYISVRDDAVCIKGGKGPDAHKRAENGIVEDVLVENCTFGESLAVLTLGSECIHARNITMRNCKVNGTSPLLKLKMRPDTYQLFENVTVENITGKVGSIINLYPWKQFFNMDGSNEKPFGTILNITISNVQVTANKFGETLGNPNDIVKNFVLKDITVTTENPTLKSKYDDLKIKNVIVNGKPLKVDVEKVSPAKKNEALD
jgi:polygalacturonase